MQRLQRLLVACCGIVLAAVTTMPGLVVASGGDHHDGRHSGGHHAGFHNGGATGWHADHARWLWSDGNRDAVRGHAWMTWDDCTGPVGLVIKARFQRHVDGHWVTTQRQTKRQHFAAGPDTTAGRDRELHFRPKFEARRGDRRHPTRIRFTYAWREGGQLHERHHLQARPQ